MSRGATWAAQSFCQQLIQHNPAALYSLVTFLLEGMPTSAARQSPTFLQDHAQYQQLACSVMEQVLQKRKQEVELYNLQSYVQIYAKHPRRAWRACQRALSLDPSNPYASQMRDLLKPALQVAHAYGGCCIAVPIFIATLVVFIAFSATPGVMPALVAASLAVSGWFLQFLNARLMHWKWSMAILLALLCFSGGFFLFQSTKQIDSWENLFESAIFLFVVDFFFAVVSAASLSSISQARDKALGSGLLSLGAPIQRREQTMPEQRS
jgi:hypothetical protein